MELLQIEKIDVQLYCCLTVVLLFGGHYSTILHVYIYISTGSWESISSVGKYFLGLWILREGLQKMSCGWRVCDLTILGPFCPRQVYNDCFPTCMSLSISRSEIPKVIMHTDIVIWYVCCMYSNRYRHIYDISIHLHTLACCCFVLQTRTDT